MKQVFSPELDASCREALAAARKELAALRPEYEVTVERIRNLRIGIRALETQFDGAATTDFWWCSGAEKDAVAVRRKLRDSQSKPSAIISHAASKGIR